MDEVQRLHSEPEQDVTNLHFQTTQPAETQAEDRSSDGAPRPNSEPKKDVIDSQSKTTQPAETQNENVVLSNARQQDPETDLGTITVTGSRLPRTSFSAAAPVTVITRQEIEESGAVTMRDLVKWIPAQTDSDDFNGYQRMNLRGLGVNSTLVLINGRRLVVVANEHIERDFGDLNIVPLAAVERIEILRGGGSAIYGSDAVAGVVNIITKRDWDGVFTDNKISTTDSFDHQEVDTSLSAGVSTQRTNITVGANYHLTTPLDASARSFTEGTYNDLFGLPGTFALVGRENAPEGAPAIEFLPDPTCGDVPGTFPMVSDGRDFCAWDRRSYKELINKIERFRTFASVDHDFTNWLGGTFEMHYGRTLHQRKSTPSLPPLTLVLVPPDHSDNPYGPYDFGVFVGRPVGIGAPAPKHDNTSDTYRLVVGLNGGFENTLRGTLLEDWNWMVTGSWGESRARYEAVDTVLEALEQGLASCTADTVEERVEAGCFNPWYSAVDGTGTPNSEDVLDRIVAERVRMIYSQLATVDIDINGSWLQLPGGKLGFALGTQYRYESREVDADHISNIDGFASMPGLSDTRRSRDVYAIYSEANLPVLMGVELNGALRLDHYRKQATRLSPYGGIVLTPGRLFGGPDVVSKLSLRGTVSTSFQAPTLLQSDPKAVSSNYTTFEQDGDLIVASVTRSGNPDLKPETAVVYTTGIEWIWQRLFMQLDFWYYDFQRRIATENAAGIYAENPDDSRIEYLFDVSGVRVIRNVNVTFFNASKVTTYGLDFAFRQELDLHKVFDSTSRIGTVSAALAGSYVISHKIRAYEDSDAIEAAGSTNHRNFAHMLPRFRMNIPLGWHSAGHSITFITHYISSFDDDGSDEYIESSGVERDEDDEPIPNIVDSFTTFDLQYGYQLEYLRDRIMTIRVGVSNLFDTDPPYVLNYSGHAAAIHDNRGRTFYLGLSMQL